MARDDADETACACVLARPMPSQRVVSSVVSTTPEADEYDEREDVFGNRVVQFGLHSPHDGLTVMAITEAVIWAQELPRVDVSWERVAATVAGLRGPMALDVAPFAAPSRIRHRRSEQVGALRSRVAGVPTGPPDRRRRRSRSAHRSSRRSRFDSSFTEVSTPLDVVLASRRGVCQDFALLAVGLSSHDRSRGPVRQRLHRDRSAARRTEVDRC